MTFRSDLDALRARHDVLETEVAARQQDLVETRRMIEEVERRARLPVQGNIRVAAPCTADWTKMAGDERVRACGDCNKNVYNLSGMTREEAEALIVEKEGRLCVRYYRRTDGTILFGDCTSGVSRRRRRKLVAGAAALLAATGLVAYGASRGAAAEEKMEEDVPWMETDATVGALTVDLPPAVDEDLVEVKGELMEVDDAAKVELQKVKLETARRLRRAAGAPGAVKPGE